MNINDLLNTTGITSQSTSTTTNPPPTPQQDPQQPTAANSVASQPTETPLQPKEDVVMPSPTLPTPSESTAEEQQKTEVNISTQSTPILPPLEDENNKEIAVPPQSEIEPAKENVDLEINEEKTLTDKLVNPTQTTDDTIANKEPATDISPDLPPTLPPLVDNNTPPPVDSTSVTTSSTETNNGTLSLENMQEQILSGNSTIESSDMKSATSAAYPYTMKQLLEIVVQKNASDLHIGANYPALIRIDGELQPVGSQVITPEIAKDLIFSILSEENKEIVEINKEVDIAYAYEDIARFRVNVYHSTGSMSAALRLIPNKIKTMEELNLPKIYQNFVNLKQGLILVTGPTGHGKSTTLAAILNEINRNKPVHIITIEDPVEYVYPIGKALVNQREMKQDTHSWDIALKSILREDPDVVLVGEMRDYETISAAITIAETGHLVFATLHTNSASQTIDRIIDVFPEHQQGQIRTQLAVVIEGIIAQRLVKLNGGGRRAVSEVMMGTAAVRNIIREGKTYQLDNVIRTSGDVGMISIERSLVDLVREGLISVEDAQLNAVNPEEVLRLLK